MASDTNLPAVGAASHAETGEKTVFKILLTISFCHLLNRVVQKVAEADGQKNLEDRLLASFCMRRRPNRRQVCVASHLETQPSLAKYPSKRMCSSHLP